MSAVNVNTPEPAESSPRQFDLIVFDWDGTLFDSTALITRCIQAACADLGATVPSDRNASHVIGLGLIDALRCAAPDLPHERYEQLGERYRYHYFTRQHELMFFEGALSMLSALKSRGHRLAVATGKSRQGLDESLQKASLQGVFDATRTADETRSKPHPQMLLELMSELDVQPARTLMVGDTTHDMQLAANAGATSVAVSYGAHDPKVFNGFGPLRVAHSVVDLHAWLMLYA